jgi:hypothetical protein
MGVEAELHVVGGEACCRSIVRLVEELVGNES